MAQSAGDRPQVETVTVRRVRAEAPDEQKSALSRTEVAYTTSTGSSRAAPLAPAQGAKSAIDGLNGETLDTAATDVAPTERRSAPDHVSRAESALRHDAPRPVMQQVAEAARGLRDGPVEMTLQPEELGKVRLTLTAAADGSMMFSVQAERSETMDLLRRHIGDLARELHDLGFENLSFSFGQDRAPAEQQRERPGDIDAAAPTIAAIPLAQTGFAARSGIPGSTSGLDLRL